MLTALVLVLLCRQDIICARCVQYVWAAAVRAPHRRPQESIRAAGITCWVASCLVCHRDWRSLAPPFPPIWQQSADIFGTVRYLSTPLLVILAAVGSHRARLGMRRLSTALCLVRVDNSGQCVRRGNFMCCRLSLSLCLSWCSHRARRSVVQGRQQQQQVRHVRVPERNADRGERTQEEVLEVGAHATDRRARVVCACGQTCALKLYIKAKPIDGNVKPPPPPKPPETPNGSCPYPPWWGPSRHATPHIAVAPQKYHTPKVP
jgi:hypothetical protein